ncbi:BatD family protein [Arenibacter sp. F26102]|uniref:BatD family protein n=1 Tax=Arenibacter sp. F26102 TaxID=2926416 RepID=UPI001FF339A7|nr:BatD family protein [Arenibacter sp. F26102]MCK0147941.1 BatD family protein [Arenibacter sp. F26102]
MRNLDLSIKNSYSYSLRYIVLCLLFSAVQGFSQNSPTIRSEVDTTYIKIGEQINFKVTVETDSTSQVIFPEGQTFSPLETVEALMTDTVRKLDRITLQKIYALTQFDSGSYTLPRQQIMVNGKPFFTDSLKIDVATVPVDTLAQKMYDIKPLINVEKSNGDLWKILLWVLGILILAGAALYWFVFRKKPLSEEEKVALLPPFDRAILGLKQLEKSKYLIQDDYKSYYSELTDIVRSYLEEDVHVTALESTTDQLIDKLEMMKDAGQLKLDHETIQQFKKVLQTSDLVKFAKSKPENSVAEQDRKSVEQIVIKTKEAIPEPTEEELLLREEYLEEVERKKQKKKIIIVAVSAVLVLLFSTAAAIGYYGLGYVKDTVLGHPTKDLLEGEWVQSHYGFPPVSLQTPKVLLRQAVKLPPEAQASIKEMQAFAYRSSYGLFTIGTTSITLTQPEDPDLDKASEQILKNFEAQGAKNITTKQEEFTTLTGVKGIKLYGSGKFAVPESKELISGNYVVLFFGGKGFQQNVILTWLADDNYADQIVDRILNSVEVKTTL